MKTTIMAQITKGRLYRRFPGAGLIMSTIGRILTANCQQGVYRYMTDFQAAGSRLANVSALH